jgi:hypothetical protein
VLVVVHQSRRALRCVAIEDVHLLADPFWLDEPDCACVVLSVIKVKVKKNSNKTHKFQELGSVLK